MSMAEISRRELDKKREWDAFAKKIESLIQNNFESRDSLYTHYVRGRITEKELTINLSKYDSRLKNAIRSAMDEHNCRLRYL